MCWQKFDVGTSSITHESFLKTGPATSLDSSVGAVHTELAVS